MKSDETAYQELFEELEKYENKGVYISMDGFPASPMQIVAAHMTREEGSYMRDYTYDKGRRKLYAGLYSGYRRIY